MCYVVQRHKHHLKQKPAHPNASRIYRNPLNRSSSRGTERKVVWYERNIVLCLFLSVSLSCFCLWTWEVSIQIVTKAKYGTRSQKSWGSGAFEVEVAVSVVASAPFLSDTDCWNASQPNIPMRARKQVWRIEGLGHKIKLGSGWQPHWHKYRLKFVALFSFSNLLGNT